MATRAQHAVLQKKITALSNALAKLGKGTDLRDLILIIRKPGWTTPAELRFAVAMVDNLQAQADLIAKTSKDLLTAAKAVELQG